MNGDTSATFNELYRRINAKDKQILATEILAQGDLPVVDQGKSQIAGYTNNLAKRFAPPEGGVIVFGDHTRLVKFVDFDFAIGADGTQLIAARGDNDTHFLAFLLSAQDIPNTGYNRHFKFLKEMAFSVPPLPEQQAIAAALSDADGVVAGLERVIAKKRLIKQGAMQDLLTARRRLPGFSGEWEVKQLGDLMSMKSGDAITSTFIREEGDYPVFGGNGLRGFTSNFNRDGECTLVGRQGALCGVVTHTVGKIFASEHAIVCKATAPNCQQFISHRLEYADLNKVSESSAQPGLSVEKIKKIEIDVPLDGLEQRAIATVLSDMDAEIQILESRLVKARAVKEGMMQNLLTGRVRLV